MDKRKIKIQTKKQQQRFLEKVSERLSETDGLQFKSDVEFLENLTHISNIMRYKLIREYDHNQLAIALKLSTTKVFIFISKNLSSTQRHNFYTEVNKAHSVEILVQAVSDLVSYLKTKGSNPEDLINLQA